ncbi:MAG: mechanosensitive ion channel, partial [Bacteroidetes bacterium]|nr:mechanosensitive ion channel [Bacteroidota bacterium]
MLDQLKIILEDPILLKVTYALIWLIAIWIIGRLLKRLTNRLTKENPIKFQLRKGISFASYIAVFLLIMAIFEVNLSGLGVALGVAGAGIAFALQEVIASIAGYLAIHMSGFYKIGDRVKLSNIKGDVIDIGILRTTIMEMGDWVSGDLYNGKMVRVANSFVFKEPVYNYSGDFPFLWDEITIPIKTNSDYALARKMMTDILNEEVGEYAHKVKNSWKQMTDLYQIEKARLEPWVTMKFDENWITFTLRFVVDVKSRGGTKDRLYTRILEAIIASKGKVEIASAAY